MSSKVNRDFIWWFSTKFIGLFLVGYPSQERGPKGPNKVCPYL
jgi:hypothetical protein